jgi:uncharacterized membrane protein
VWCEITNPENTIIPVVPQIPKGETFSFAVTAGNNSDGIETVLFGIKATLPSGTTTRFLVGPIQVTLDPYESRSAHLSHFIPSNVELGTYTCRGYVGRPGVGIIDECQSDFEVIEAWDGV